MSIRATRLCAVVASIDAAGHEHVLDGIEDALLLASWEFGNSFKKVAGLARGRSLAFGFGESKEFVNADAEGFCQGGEDFAAGGLIPSFPKSDIGLIDAEAGGELPLR
jgi:hypothetical protein